MKKYHTSHVKSIVIVLFGIVAHGPSGCSDPEVKPYICEERPERPAKLVAAGSGANIPLFLELARRYTHKSGEEILIPDSIGTRGAIHALKDGAIDMGLLSRPLKPSEKSPYMVEVPIGQTSLVVAVHRNVKGAQLDRKTVGRLFSGEMKRWPDGTPVIPIQREQGDSGWQIVAHAAPNLFASIKMGSTRGDQKVCYTDTEVLKTLERVKGSVGVIDEGSARILQSPLRWEPINGAKRILYILIKTNFSPQVSAFLEYLKTDDAVDYMRQNGYEPLVQRGPVNAR